MLRPDNIFQDHMMLQREKDIHIWGTAEAGETVTVEMAGIKSSCESDGEGRWKVILPGLPAMEMQSMRIYTDREQTEFSDISVGEVWIAGGQSNMEYLMKYDADRYEEYRRSANRQIRFYDVPHKAFAEDDNPTEQQGMWRIADRDNLPFFSAAAYYFAFELQKKLNVPVGIVGCNWGGTTALTWTDRERLKSHPTLKKYWEEFICESEKTPEDIYEKQYRECKASYRRFDEIYNDSVMYGISWLQQQEHMERLKTLPPLPVGKWDVNAPGNLYDSMVRKIAGFGTRGVIWYQGEGDWMRADDYAELFRQVILSWRSLWQETLPFLYVQIAPFYRWLGETGEKYPVVRRQQELEMSMTENVWMTSTTDCGMKWDIHPKRKKHIGERLALLARGKVYGEDIVCEPPECREICYDKDRIYLYFTSVGIGLVQTDPYQRYMYAWYGEEKEEIRHMKCENGMIIAENPRNGIKPDKISFMDEAYGDCVIYNSEKIPLKPFEKEVADRRDWWKNSVVYQVYPRSFQDSNGDGIGDLNGITSRLPYLHQLGIDVIWLSPVYDSPNDDNGYDIRDYRKIMKEFGTMADFERMLRTAHEYGIRIMMDLVVNHTSDEHEWFRQSRSSRDNPYRDYYIWREGKEDGSLPNNWESCFSGSAWEFDEKTQMYYLHLFSKKQPDLNWDNLKVREGVFRMMRWWLDKGIDGFRMDVISLISKKEGLPDGPAGINGYAEFYETANGPHVHEYLKEMRRKVLDCRDLITVGECSGVTLEEAKKYAASDGSELNMVFQFEHMDVDSENGNKWTDKKMKLTELKEIMDKWQNGLEGKAWNSLFWCNHDQPRIVSRFGNDNKEYRELSAKMLATCLHLMKGTPYIYQGEELGMTNAPFKKLEDFRDLDSINAFYELTGKSICSEDEMMNYLRYKSRDNARTPMQWNTENNAGFTDGKPWIMMNPNYKEINAQEQVGRPDSVYNYYKQLISFRHLNDIVTSGSYTPFMSDSEKIYGYIRKLKNRQLLVLCNFSDTTANIKIPDVFKNGHIIFHNYEKAEVICTCLRPYETVVIDFE